MDSTRHSYYPGAEFVLTLTPSFFKETTMTELVACASVQVKVLHTYKFTRSQTTKVEILSVAGETSLRTHQILKLYDHRYLGDRIHEEARNP